MPRRKHRGTRTAALAVLRRWMPAVMLVMTLATGAAALAEARQSVLLRHDSTRDLVRSHGAVIAWTFARHADAALGDSIEAMLPRARAALASPPTPGTEMRDAALPPSFRIPLSGGAPAFAGRAMSAHDRHATIHALRHAAPSPSSSSPDGGSFVVTEARGDRPALLAYTVSGSGAERAATGIRLDSAALAPILNAVLARHPLLPDSLAGGVPTARLAMVHLLPASSEVPLYQAGGGDWGAGRTQALGPRFGGVRVRGSLQGPAAHALLMGGHAPSRVFVLSHLMLLAAATGVVAVLLLRREDELARLRSDFVSSASHELRTPLTQIRLFLETLRLGRYRTDAQREWILDNVERETLRLVTLVDNVLQFSRGERASLVGDRTAVSLPEYVGAVVAGFAPLAASKEVRVTADVEPGLHAHLDAEAFRQVILNLLDNAVKYGPPGQTVRVRARLAGDRVRLEVDDDGPGIDPSERAKVWEPFRRGRKAVGSVAAGSGIGLAVVRQIVEQHDGTARATDAPGGGARIVVELPGWRAGPEAPPAASTLGNGGEA